MPDIMRVPDAERQVAQVAKDRACILAVIRRHIDACEVDKSQPVLVVGGGQDDLEMLSICGFENIVLSNLDADGMALDAENIALPDDSYPVIFAHAVLHHCRSPQKAVGEMTRVCQKHAFFLEPNDSWAIRALVRLGFSFPYELAAVAANGYTRGGVRNGPIPNFIYRWTEREVMKSISAYHPEREFTVRAYPYWDFYVNESELLARKESRVALLAERLGPGNLVSLLHFIQIFLNALPLSRSQGNKFFCSISKQGLQPWIDMRDGNCQLKRKTDPFP